MSLWSFHVLSGCGLGPMLISEEGARSSGAGFSGTSCATRHFGPRHTGPSIFTHLGQHQTWVPLGESAFHRALGQRFASSSFGTPSPGGGTRRTDRLQALLLVEKITVLIEKGRKGTLTLPFLRRPEGLLPCSWSGFRGRRDVVRQRDLDPRDRQATSQTCDRRRCVCVSCVT